MTTGTVFAAGSVIEVRDEEWIVSSCEPAGDGWKVRCVGSSELVRSMPATFYSTLDEIEALDPAEAELVQDDSPHFRRSRLWVEAVLRKTPVPLHEPGLTVSQHMLLDPLGFQRQAVAQALDSARLRPRVHVDIPWSLIRIEQRNGRIDRYGQLHPPRIVALALTTTDEKFSGDVRVLTRLLAKEHAAHTALGDAASLLRLHDVGREEDEIRRALVSGKALDEVVPDPKPLNELDGGDAEFEAFFAGFGQDVAPPPPVVDRRGLFDREVDFLREALREAFPNPAAGHRSGGVGWVEHPEEGLVELIPPPDLMTRLTILPQSYLAQRKVREKLLLAVTPEAGSESLRRATQGTAPGDQSTQWPQAHYLSPLHPVLDWAVDRALTRLGRNQVPVATAAISAPTALVLGTLTKWKEREEHNKITPRSGLTALSTTFGAELVRLREHGDVDQLHALHASVREALLIPGAEAVWSSERAGNEMTVPAVVPKTPSGTHLLVLQARDAATVEDLLDGTGAEHLLSPATVDGAEETSTVQVISGVFLTEEPPALVLVTAGGWLLLAERGSWPEGRWLAVDLATALERRDTKAAGELETIAALVSGDSLRPGDDGNTPLLTLLDESVKHAVGVSKDLRNGVRESIELLATEVLRRRRARSSGCCRSAPPSTPRATGWTGCASWS